MEAVIHATRQACGRPVFFEDRLYAAKRFSPRRRRDGRQWPLGHAPRRASGRRPPRRSRGGAARGRGSACARHRGPHVVRVLGGQLEAADGRGDGPDAPVRPLPAAGAREAPRPRCAPQDRGATRSAPRTAGRRYRPGRGGDGHGPPPLPQARHRLLGAVGDPGRRDPARCRSPDPHRRGATSVGFPAVGMRLRRALLQRYDVARFRCRRARPRRRRVPGAGAPLRQPPNRRAQGGDRLITDGLTPLNLLALCAFVGGSSVALLAIGAALIARRRELVRRFTLGLGAAWVLYGAGFFIAALTSRDVVLAPGAEKHLCEIDCHLAYSVVGVRTTPTLGSGAVRQHARGVFRVVTIRVRFDSATMSPHRGMAPLWPGEHRIDLADGAGSHYAYSLAAHGALGAGDAPPPTPPPVPRGSHTPAAAFDLPADAGRLLLATAGPAP